MLEMVPCRVYTMQCLALILFGNMLLVTSHLYEPRPPLNAMIQPLSDQAAAPSVLIWHWYVNSGFSIDKWKTLCSGKSPSVHSVNAMLM